MAKNPNKHRNVAIASIAIAMLILVGGALMALNQLNQFTPTEISLAFQPQVYVSQGDNAMVEVEVNSTEGAGTITLSGEVSVSNVTCTFEPAIAASNFTSTLRVDVSDCTPIGNYTIRILASSLGAVANASLVLSVLNAEPVTVSGVASSASFSNSSLSNLSGIEFTDVQTGTKTYVDLIGYYPFDMTSPDYPFRFINYPSRHYSTKLMNEHTYNVTICYYWGKQGNVSTVDTYVGNFTVHLPAGEASIHKDIP